MSRPRAARRVIVLTVDLRCGDALSVEHLVNFLQRHDVKADAFGVTPNTAMKPLHELVASIYSIRPDTPAAAPAAMTPEQKINQLNKLAAGGYITPEEYKAKKQAILDSL